MMGSSFKGLDLFGSGPHRFQVGRLGRRVISFAALTGDLSVEGASEFGDRDLRVRVLGRLVASSDAGLWALRDAILAQADSSVGSGILIDQHGHQWDTLRLLTMEESGFTDRGRVVSVDYVVEFGRLASG